MAGIALSILGLALRDAPESASSRSWTFAGNVTSVGFGQQGIAVTAENRLWVLDPLDWDKEGARFRPLGPELPAHYRLVNCAGYLLLFRQGAIVVGSEVKDAGAAPALIVQRLGRGGPIGWTKIDPESGERLSAWAPARMLNGALTLLETPISPISEAAKEVEVVGRAMGSITDSEELLGAVVRRSNTRDFEVVPTRWIDGIAKPYELPSEFREAFPIYRADTFNFFGVAASSSSLLKSWKKWSFGDPGPSAKPVVFTYDRLVTLPLPTLTEDEKKRKCEYAGVAVTGAHARLAAGPVFLYSPQGGDWTIERSEPCAWVNRRPILLREHLPAGFSQPQVMIAEDRGRTEDDEGKVARIWLIGRLKGKTAIAVVVLRG